MTNRNHDDDILEYIDFDDLVGLSEDSAYEEPSDSDVTITAKPARPQKQKAQKRSSAQTARSEHVRSSAQTARSEQARSSAQTIHTEFLHSSTPAPRSEISRAAAEDARRGSDYDGFEDIVQFDDLDGIREDAAQKAAAVSGAPRRVRGARTGKVQSDRSERVADRQERVSRADRRPRRDDDEMPNKGLHIGIHLILLIVIVAIVIVAGVRYFNWSRGTEITLDPTASSKYAIEVKDSMVLLPDSKMEGHEDDGQTTILALGNAPFSDETGPNGLAGQIEALSDATVINASFPNSQVACFNAKYDPSTLSGMDDIFNLFYVAYAISIDDYTSLETVASAHPDVPQYQAAVDALKSTDFSKVDVIAIMYDAIDYENKTPVQNPDNPDDLTTYVNSMRYAFQLIQDKYPYIRIVFMSPTYMMYKDADGDLSNGRTQNLGNGTLIQYWQWAYDTCGDSSVSFLDNYYGSVNESNYEEYLADNIHLNDAGRTKIADHFVYKVINGTYKEYDVGAMAIAK